MRSTVLVVDHQPDVWQNVNGNPDLNKIQIQVVEDGLEAYMELASKDYEAVLVRSDMEGGVTPEELAFLSNKHNPDGEFVLMGEKNQNFGDDIPSGQEENTIQSVNRIPRKNTDAVRLLQETVSQQRDIRV